MGWGYWMVLGLWNNDQSVPGVWASHQRVSVTTWATESYWLLDKLLKVYISSEKYVSIFFFLMCHLWKRSSYEQSQTSLALPIWLMWRSFIPEGWCQNGTYLTPVLCKSSDCQGSHWQSSFRQWQSKFDCDFDGPSLQGRKYYVTWAIWLWTRS